MGRRAVQKFEAWASNNGANMVQIYATKESRGFWKKMGYTLEGEGKNLLYKGYKKIVPSKNTSSQLTSIWKQANPEASFSPEVKRIMNMRK